MEHINDGPLSRLGLGRTDELAHCNANPSRHPGALRDYAGLAADEFLSAGNPTSDNGAAFPDLFTAVNVQLGLKLERTKGLVDIFVLDHVERPSEN
jgi:uncharacterized protein (TIGR03435 family)